MKMQVNLVCFLADDKELTFQVELGTVPQKGEKLSVPVDGTERVFVVTVVKWLLTTNTQVGGLDKGGTLNRVDVQAELE